MCLMRRGFLFLAFHLALCGGSDLCLSTGIPEAQRSYVLNSTNQQSPIRIATFAWNEGQLLSTIAEILISEVLGFHVLLDPDMIQSQVPGILRLAGCYSSECEERQAHADVLLGIWLTWEQAFFEQFQATYNVAEDLGSIGHEGVFSMFVKGEVLQEAASSGLYLENYKSYNLSLHEPSDYFSTLWDLPSSELLECNASWFGLPFHLMDSAKMKNYLDQTGDVDGIIEQDGQYRANCQLPKFWISPACRQNYSRCIPVLQGGIGGEDINMQRSTAYGMPIALAFAVNIPQMVQMVREHRVIHQWWEPDPNFLEMNPTKIIFPAHSKSAFAQGDFRTDSTKVYIAKLAASFLRISAPRVRSFLQNMEVEKPELLELMKGGPVDIASEVHPWFRERACDWIRSPASTWNGWIPVATDCTPGYGLANVQGTLVASVIEAVDCLMCPPGHFSQQFSEGSGATYRCEECRPGYHQSRFGQTSCIACEAGKYAAVAGSAACEPCSRGSFVNSSAATECFFCGPTDAWTTSKAEDVAQEKWIEIEEATSASFCRCAQGWHLSPAGQCEVCIKGSSCPGSGVLQLLPGFYSTKSDPGSVMECFGTSRLRCPGGEPESCAAGRDPGSVVCSLCLPGFRSEMEECVPCTGQDYLALAILAAVILLGTGALHILLALLGGSSGSHHSTLLTAALCANQLVTCAQIFSVMEQMQGLQWTEPFTSFLQIFRVLSLKALLDSVKTVGCVARVSPEWTFLIRNLMVPTFFAIGPVVVHLVMKSKGSKKKSTLVKTFGFLFLLFYISLCSSFAEPFRCNLHPNGRMTMQTAHQVFCDFSGHHLNLSWMSAVICLIPIGFLCACSYLLLVVLPSRLQGASASFLMAYSFLILRFKPGHEAFTVVFLVRNLLIVLTPMLPSLSGILIISSMLALTVGVVAYFTPWRSDLSNEVDIFVNLALLLVLQLGLLTVKDSDPRSLMVLSTVCGVLVLVVLVMVAVYSVQRYVSSKFRKKFAFFLSHHRSASAAFARLLSLELKRCSSNFTSFIDSDNLTDLSRLLAHVSRDTQTFVLIGSPHVLKRKWCVGELTMAKLAELDVVLLKFPDFALPQEQFIQNYGCLVPDIGDLTMYGLGMTDVQDTLRWLSNVTSYEVAPSISKESLASTIRQLTGTAFKRHHPGSFTEYVILADPDNMEAMATAQVLGLFLVSILPERGLSPRVLTAEGQVSRTDSRIILLCSYGCFRSPQFARWLLQVRAMPDCQILPLLGDERFQLPSSQGEGPVPQAFVEGVDPIAYSQVIKAVFLELALPYIPAQNSEVDLKIRSHQVAARLYGNLKPISDKLLISGRAPVSPDEGSEQLSARSSNASLHALTRVEVQEVVPEVEDVNLILASEMIAHTF